MARGRLPPYCIVLSRCSLLPTTRLPSAVPIPQNVRSLFATLLAAMPAFGNVGALIGLIFFMWVTRGCGCVVGVGAGEGAGVAQDHTDCAHCRSRVGVLWVRAQLPCRRAQPVCTTGGGCS